MGLVSPHIGRGLIVCLDTDYLLGKMPIAQLHDEILPLMQGDGKDQ